MGVAHEACVECVWSVEHVWNVECGAWSVERVWSMYGVCVECGVCVERV